MKAKLRQVLKSIRECKNLPEWIVVMAVLTFSMFTMFYTDFQATMDFAYQVTRQIFQGDFGGIKYLAANPYGMTLYLILVIWMIPFYPFSAIVSEEFWYYGSLSGAVWSKLFLVIMTALLLKAVMKLSELLQIKEQYRKWVPLFMLTSVFYFLPVVEIGQCDIISLAFMMWGLVYYLKGDLKRFLLFFAIAIPMKYFALMVFVPLVLLHEKKPIRIIMQGIGGVSLLGINLLIRRAVSGVMLGEFTTSSISNMTSISNTTGVLEEAAQNTTIYIESNALESFLGTYVANSSFFVLCYILICVLAYAMQYNEEKRLWSMYIPVLVFASFFLLTDANIYWFVLLLPFVTLLCFANAAQIRLNMLLETAAGWAVLFIHIYKVAWVVGGDTTFEYLFLRGKTVGTHVEVFLHHVYDLTALLPYANTLFVASMAGLLLVNIPALVKKQNENVKEEAFDRWIIWLRTGLLLLWVFLVVYILLIREK